MKKIVTAFLGLVIAGSAVLGLSDVASARPGVNHRQNNQQTRIYRGVRNGSLTRREFGRLERRQGSIRNQASRFRRDGRFSRRERGIVQSRLRGSSHSIYRARHNNRYRTW